MPFPSLGLGRAAGAVDAAVLRHVGGAVRRGTGQATRRALSAGARFGARAGLAGMGLGLSVAGAAVVGAVGAAHLAARTFDRMMNVPQFNPGVNGGLPFIDRGGRLITWQKHGQIPYTNRHLYSPAISSRVSNIVAGGGVTAGIIGGANDYYQSKNWNVTQAPSTGALEVERDNFMGATGSLTLAMYKQRHGRRAPQTIQTEGLQANAMRMDQAETIHALHMAGRALE